MSIILFFKALFRIFSFVALILAVLVGVMDSVRSVATHSIDMMSAYAVWSLLLPQALEFSSSLIEHYLHPEAWRSLRLFLQDVPACGVLLCLSLIFWIAGYRKRRQRQPGFVAFV